MRVVTVAAETSTAKELERARKGEELSTIGLFDWAIEELEEAKKTATNSPKINLALAKHYRLKSDNVRALLALKDSYPDYSQMFPEEMGREEWDIFYPLTHWNEIKFWARQRKLDPNNVAGLIRQETIFNPRARSRANAYGMMQLLIPTARSMARKYGSSASISGAALFEPMLNIELGTAYMREQLNKYGRIEYMSVAYNAGPGRVVSWRRTLPLQMDEFVEEIPFSETRGYVKGIIRNSAQYRRLYDISGSFKPNVGSKPIRAQIDSMSSDQFTAVNPEIEVDRIKRSEE
jgi:soluble lytic murein transglycosylase